MAQTTHPTKQLIRDYIHAIVLNELIPEDARAVGTNSMYNGHPALRDSLK